LPNTAGSTGELTTATLGQPLVAIARSAFDGSGYAASAAAGMTANTWPLGPTAAEKTRVK
jgi:hypothetical protein